MEKQLTFTATYTSYDSLDEVPEVYKALITEKIKLRKNLRRIQQGMNEQVEQLGRNIKLLNIFLIPIILLIIAFVVFIRRRMPRNYSRVRRDTI